MDIRTSFLKGLCIYRYRIPYPNAEMLILTYTTAKKANLFALSRGKPLSRCLQPGF